MSTRGTTYWDDEVTPMEWTPTPKPWCPECCVRADQCGCPKGERLTNEHEAHIIRGTE